MKSSPCKGCEKRSITCHTTCEEYITWNEEHRKLVQKVVKLKGMEKTFRWGR